MSSGGVNLNTTVSNVLALIHPKVAIVYRRYAGTENVLGVRTPVYAEPITTMAQVQAPDPSMLRKVDKGNDASVRKAFWVDAALSPICRPDGKGGDIIEYDGHSWQVIAIQDDFRLVGWVCVLGEMRLGS